MLAPETVLQSRYRIIRQLGQGGMGAVYEATDERLDTVVALKETLFTDERLRKQFEREARLLARMHHPALPRVSDHFAEGDGQFLIMQYIAGDDLFQKMARKRGPFPPDQVLTWGDQLLDALDYLHTQDPQIIHRDIKPQNLKLTSRGQIILLDFGLAKGQGGEVSRVGTTSASIFGYTPNYAPLEQIQGLGTDARSDIYALSATLYHLMTGVKPPDALSRAAAIVNGQEDPLKPANEINSGIGPGVSSVLARAMSQNREQRYSSAAAMREALSGSPEVATLAERSEAATVILESPATTRPAVPGTDVKPLPAVASETTVLRAPPRGSRRIAPWAIGAAAVVLIGVVCGAYFAFQRLNNSAATTPAVNANEQANASSSSPSPEQAQASTEASGGAELEKEAANINDPAQAAKVLKQNEKSLKQAEKVAAAAAPASGAQTNPTNPTPPRVDGNKANPEFNPVPAVPEINVPDPNRMGSRRLRRLGLPVVRNFPDGTQLITHPDGTRIVIKPNGARRVYRPGERIDRNNP